MNQSEYAKVIAKNLKRIAYEHKKSQADICRDLKLRQGTVSSWMVGKRVPRMDKIDMLCNYFNCSRAEIMQSDPAGRQDYLDVVEQELIRRFRNLPEEKRAGLLEYARFLDSTKEKTDSSKVG